ncbi:hypothetical protein DFQ01_12176 [Paenibacillus cellulosilyticus]|uniref:Copper amine oxidase-like protein n=1 Tax=Paenibacillus cellulosilyticus TaxID=375489 RepID=A0A2V2YS73_9BACL|nr:hypothetical protein [Paenibacillus cellulosilyticus]PWV97432.1 hypothetical protein DFQ01_12176 [Paenibacillus cellulosilyticus]QKS48529.1 hypothetical protein HUB94_30305 [Paenibacillus cellulosilyticus]
MRKYIIGFIIGIIAASAVPVYGAVSTLVGKKVEGEIPVSYNSKQIGNGIIIDGRSYLPVRSVSDAVGLNLNVSKEGVQLSTATIPTDPFDAIQDKKNELMVVDGKRIIAVRERDQLKNSLEQPNKEYERAKQFLASITEEDPHYQKTVEGIAYYEQLDADNRARLAELETEIAEYDVQIAALEAELAELESK